MATTLNVSGMHCGACLRRLEKALGALPAGTVREVALGRVVYEGVSPEAVVAAVVAAGFEVDDATTDASGSEP